ncbi:MAG: SUMF1/EgtB/PvdO family nonheme iron enzyme [Bacteroidaceae bacterium]|nr:SUMF1/EgtB/PvdO family nonheme iron enzyme [Bacteroidaceae bacterium]
MKRLFCIPHSAFCIKVSLFCILLSAFCISLNAQELRIKSFASDDIDLSARTQRVLDANNNGCALVKVGMAIDGVQFFGDVVKVVPYVSEYWVYLAGGASYLEIHAPRFLPIIYEFTEPLERLRTYRLTISSPATVPGSFAAGQVSNAGFLIINTEPQGCRVYLDGEEEGITPFSKRFPLNTNISYRLTHDLYKDAEGSVTINQSQTPLNISLTPNFASVQVVTLPNAEVKVGGVVKGKGTTTLYLTDGIYEIEAALYGHRPAKQFIEVKNSQNQTISITPTPLYGALSIESNPMGAEIFINGISYGKTPNILENMLAGNYTVVLKKDGFNDFRQQVKVEDNKETVVSGVMDNGGDLLTITAKGIRFKMVPVKGGTFLMGTTVSGSSASSPSGADEKPAHRVTLSDYYIGQTEVTQELWEAVMGYNPSHFKGDNRPVEEVSWDDCQLFCQRLSSITGLKFLLPTEAQWEFAARGGIKTKKNNTNTYAGTNDLWDFGWFNDNAKETQLVATKQENELGIYDMSGNVWEWCSDLYGDYPYGSQTNPTGSQTGNYRIYRGGSWFSNQKDCRITRRANSSPDFAHFYLGLRVVLEPTIKR